MDPMRNWINVLLEADRPAASKERKKSSMGFNFAQPEQSKGDVATTGQTTGTDIDPGQVKQASKRSAQDKFKRMARDPRYQRAASQAMANMPAEFMQTDPDDDEAEGYGEVEPTPPEPDNLPARISKEVAQPDFDPEWVKVHDLPGYVKTQLRKISKDLFSNILPMDNFGDINFISTLTHPEDEVKVVSKWVQQNAQKDDDAYFNVEPIPGYEVRAQLYRTKNANFFVAKDWMNGEVAGYYVYMWPGGRGTEVGAEDKKRIR